MALTDFNGNFIYNPDRTVFRVHARGDAPVELIREYLAAMEHAYNSSFVFDQLIEQAINIGRTSDNQPPLPISALLWHSWWPPTPDKVAAFIPEDQKLILDGVVLQSPGFWDFVGNMNPLQMLLTYLNERHERQKDLDYRNSAEEWKLYLENKALENKIVAGRAEILQDLGATENEISVLRSQLLGQPLQSLSAFQDRGLITDAEFVYDRPPKNLDTNFSRPMSNQRQQRYKTTLMTQIWPHVGESYSELEEMDLDSLEELLDSIDWIPTKKADDVIALE
mgnify:CR=1 FL=1